MRDPNNPNKIVIELEDLYDDVGTEGQNGYAENFSNRSRRPNQNAHHYDSYAVNQGHSNRQNYRDTGYNRAAHPSGKNRIAAALFAIFLGGFGVHKFYLGQTGKGILYLVFCWTAIPGIIGFIEGIIYLTMSDEDFERKHLTIPSRY